MIKPIFFPFSLMFSNIFLASLLIKNPFKKSLLWAKAVKNQIKMAKTKNKKQKTEKMLQITTIWENKKLVNDKLSLYIHQPGKRKKQQYTLLVET